MLYVEYCIEKFRADGQLLESWKKPSKSFILNFIKTLYRAMSLDIGDDANMTTIFDILDNPVNLIYYTNLFYCAGTSGKSRQYMKSEYAYTYGEYLGIVVGTTSTAVAPSQTKLITPIAHGTAAGELEYFGMLVMDEADFNVDTGTDEAYFEIERIFRNASGNSITIEEIGINALAQSIGSSSNKVFCILGDVDTIVVADGEYLKIKYRIKVAS